MEMNMMFTTGDRAEDLVGWASKLSSIGQIMHKYEPDTVGIEINVLGEIIIDYAEAIKAVANKAYMAIGDYFDKNDSPFEDVKSRYDELKTMAETSCKQGQLKTVLKDVESIIKDIQPLYELRQSILGNLGLPVHNDNGLEDKNGKTFNMQLIKK